MKAIPVHFWLYTKDNLDTFEDMVFDGAEVHLNNNTLFDPSKPTKLVVHGWGGGTHIDQIFAGAYAMAGLDYNIIGVDWRDMEGSAQEQVVSVGAYAAHFVQALVMGSNLRLEDVHPIGWSYGAHVVGSKALFIQILRLTFCSQHWKRNKPPEPSQAAENHAA